MAIDIPIYSKKIVDLLASKGPGKYRLYLKDVNFSLFPNWPVGYTTTVSGSIMTVLERTDNTAANTSVLALEVKPDPMAVNESAVEWGLIAVGLLVAGVLVAGAFTIDKVEKIIDSPGGQAALVGGGLLIVIIVVVGIYGLYRYVVKKTK